MSRGANELKKKSGIEMRADAAARAAAAADPAQRARLALAACERAIESARQSFLDMGRALLEIRTEKLYEADGFVAFDEYVLDRWEITARQANRLIVSHRIDLILGPIGLKLQSEAAARELIPIADDEPALVAVYEEAVRRAAGGRVTAALVAASRDSLAPPVIEGKLADPLDSIPDAAKQAIADRVNQTPTGGDPVGGTSAVSGVPAGSVGPSPIDGPGTQDPPVDQPEPSNAAEGEPDAPSRAGVEGDHGQPEPGEAAEDASASNDSAGGTTGPEGESSPGASGPVAERERQEAAAGVSIPAAPVSKRQETDEEQAAREEREIREARSLEFATGLVNVRMRLEPDPVRWYREVYIHGLYHARDLPRVKDSFTPVGLRQAARFLLVLAEHLETTGEEL